MQISTTIPSGDKAALLGAELTTGACAATSEILAFLDADGRQKSPESAPIEAAKREERSDNQSVKLGL